MIGILEEIDSFYWPKMHLWKGDKKIGQGPPLPPHLDKIQKNSNFFFRETVPNFHYKYKQRHQQHLYNLMKREIIFFFLPMRCATLIMKTMTKQEVQVAY